MASQTKAQVALKRKVKRLQESLKFIGLLGRSYHAEQRGGHGRTKCGGGYRVNRRGNNKHYDGDSR